MMNKLNDILRENNRKDLLSVDYVWDCDDYRDVINILMDHINYMEDSAKRSAQNSGELDKLQSDLQLINSAYEDCKAAYTEKDRQVGELIKVLYALLNK